MIGCSLVIPSMVARSTIGTRTAPTVARIVEVVGQRGRDVAPAGIERFDARERVDPDHWLEQPWLGAIGKAHVAVDECRLVVALGEDHDVAEVRIVGRDIEPAASGAKPSALRRSRYLAAVEAREGGASAEIGGLAAARGTGPGILDVDVDAWDIDGARLRSFALLGDGGGDVSPRRQRPVRVA